MRAISQRGLYNFRGRAWDRRRQSAVGAGTRRAVDAVARLMPARTKAERGSAASRQLVCAPAAPIKARHRIQEIGLLPISASPPLNTVANVAGPGVPERPHKRTP